MISKSLDLTGQSLWKYPLANDTIDKQDINEELVRLDSHLDVLKSYLSEKNEIGKKINFILQEIGREINTITSKSSNIKITYEVLSMKNQVEQIREQAQNIL